MANVMSLKSVRNKPHRDGFDLSKRNLFTAKISELLPVYCKEVLPGDNFNINLRWFTRTRPVNTAAYTRFREYYDWFFVPANLMWNKFNTFISQTVDNPFHANSLSTSQKVSDKHPYFTVSDVEEFLASDYFTDPPLNFFGYDRRRLWIKLLHYLGYGDFHTGFSVEDVALNPFPLLAYQKIYQDYYRDSQWEKAAPYTCNLDYMSSSSNTDIESMHMNLEYLNFDNDTMFDLRYANWHKDYFMGLMPSAQFGDAASVDLSSLLEFKTVSDISLRSVSPSGTLLLQNDSQVSPFQSVLINNNSDAPSSFFGFTSTGVERIAHSMGLTPERLASVFTILGLRQAEAMQKWKEITQANNQDYKSQVEAHFGVSLPENMSERCQFLDGVVNNIDINEVVNTNLADMSVEANIAGKGAAAGQGEIHFNSKVHGYIMCIYHCVPLLDYSITGIKRQNLKTHVTDYAIPEFDQTGMVQVPMVELINRVESRSDLLNYPKLLGYAPRYVDYKTDIDEVHGAFYDGSASDRAWVAPINQEYILNYLKDLSAYGATSIDYRWFKIPPSVVDNIFGVDANSETETDQLLINCGFDVKCVRNLDYNGLPY